MTDRTAADWSGIIAGLGLDVDKASAALAMLDAERSPLPLAAATGDVAAGKALVAIDRRRQELRARIDLLRDGIEDARARHAAAVAAEAEAQAAERLAAARVIALRVLAVDRDKIAAGFALIREGFEERHELVLSLAKTGQLDGAKHLKLRNRTMIGAALHHAGLDAHLPIDRVQSRHWQSIETWDNRWLSGLLPAGSAPPAPPQEPPLPPPSSPPEGDGMSEADWEAAEEREAARSFGRRAA